MQFSYVSRSKPCNLCGGTTDCRSLANGLVFCRRTDRNSPPNGWHYLRDDAQGFPMFAPDDSSTSWSDRDQKRARVAEELRKDRKRSKSPFKPIPISKVDRITREKTRQTDRQIERYGQELSITIRRETVDAIGTDFLSNDGNNYPAWVTPLCTAAGEVKGYTARYRIEDREKVGLKTRTWGDGSCLILPSNWATNDHDHATVYVPEGASDVTALIEHGYNAFGRVNNTSGAEQISELIIANPDADICLVAENDTNGAGRDGAESVAEKIFAATGRRVKIVYPPPIYKDVRDMFVARDVSFREHAERTAVEYTPKHGWTAPATRPASPAPTTTTTANFTSARTPNPFAMDVDDLRRAHDIERGAEKNPCYFEPSKCERKRTVLQKHKFQNSRWRCLFVDCRQLSCPHCRERSRDQRLCTVATRIMDHKTANPEATFYGFWASSAKINHGKQRADGSRPEPTSDWDTISRTLRKRGAEYFKHASGDRVFVISTKEPASRFTGLVEMTAEEAIERSQAAIVCDNVVDEEAFTTSRGWKLIDSESERSGKWENIPLAVSQRSALAILSHHKLKVRKTLIEGLFFGVEVHEFDPGKKPDDIEGDLTAGEVISSITFKGWDLEMPGKIDPKIIAKDFIPF